MKILYFDTETTGFSPPAIVQLWFISEVIHDSWAWWYQEWNHLFNPLIKINPQAAKVHWLTDKMVKDKPLFKTILKEFIKITNDVDYICWHNVQFDLKALFFEVDRAFPKWSPDIDKWKQMMKDKSICTMNASINVCKIPWKYWKFKWPKLSELHIHLFWEDFEWAHDAMADIIATRRCYLELKQMWIIK